MRFRAMTRLSGFLSRVPDIGRLKEAGDTAALIRYLGNADPSVRWQAADALGACGEKAVPPLIRALKSGSVPVRLGAAGSLGAIRNPRATGPLTEIAGRDPSPEVRWAAVLALGEIGSLGSVPFLVSLLGDPDRYVRYGAATALGRLGWEPEDDAGAAALLIAGQDWERAGALGAAAVPQLRKIFPGSDPAARERIAGILPGTGGPEVQELCLTALKDPVPGVRWRAVLAAMDCGVATRSLPLTAAARTRTGPDPAAAALLNFLFLGIGYNYLGRWWGFPVFMAYMSVLVLAQLATGPFLPYLVAYPLTAIIGVHTYFTAARMSER